MKILKGILVAITGLILIVALIGGGVWGYNWYQIEQELTMWSDGEWNWHQRNLRIQIWKDKEGQPTLRRVERDDKYVMHVRLNEDEASPHTVWVFWRQECKPETEIVTSKKYSGGEPVKLYCSEEGDSVQYAVRLKKFEGRIHRSIDGFEFDEYVESWDLAPLHRARALSQSQERKE